MSTKNSGFYSIYSGKKVLVTGHTGFKGSWLIAWLLKLGAEVIGVAKDVPTQPAMFEELHLSDRIRHHNRDIRNLSDLKQLIADERPEFLFHLAAQAIVSLSYTDPIETISSNAMGTMHVVEALRQVNWPCVAVLITSDKCYDNVEWIWGYRETDSLGGRDVYSGSKGAAELIIKSYFHSFFKSQDQPVRLGIGRAGNVIGGGDWAKDRIVVDCMRAWSEGKIVKIRNPRATRPWQHVLEPLSGYLTLGAALSRTPSLCGEAFNFGPRAEQNRSVAELLSDLAHYWGFSDKTQAYDVADALSFHEASLLKLNCDKALSHLMWEPTLDYGETIQWVAEWYSAYYRQKRNMYDVTFSQIENYERLARERCRTWIR